MKLDMANPVWGFIGTLISFLGFAVTIIMLFKTKKIAQAAKDSMVKTQNEVQKNVLLTDISSCIGLIREVRAFMQEKRYDASLLRIEDLNSKLIQLRHIKGFDTEFSRQQFQSVISQLYVIRKNFEESLREENILIDEERTLDVLMRISDKLDNWIGQYKYKVSEE